jgi:hypothetical protein
MDLNKLTKPALVALLEDLIDELDTLDQEDFFGTEGWRHFLNMEQYEL